jgi:hypothetical protein
MTPLVLETMCLTSLIAKSTTGKVIELVLPTYLPENNLCAEDNSAFRDKPCRMLNFSNISANIAVAIFRVNVFGKPNNQKAN